MNRERVIDSPEGNCTGSSKDWVMIEFEVPSNKLSPIRGMEISDKLFFCTNFESTKQWVDPELTSAEIGGELGRRDNTVLSLCRGLRTAYYFFELSDSFGFSLAWAAQALALADFDFGQLLAIWPTSPQTMHKLLLKHLCLSWGVSLPSFLRTLAMELEEDDALGLLEF